MPRHPILKILGVIASVGLLIGWAAATAQDPDPRKATADPLASAETPPTGPEKVIDGAISRLKKEVQSVEADLAVNADMLNQKFRLDGTYKRAKGNRVLLLLSLAGSPDDSDRMLQVCDGQTLWEYQKVLESRNYVKRSLDKILKTMDNPALDEEIREGILTSMGFSGPETLLAGLRKTFAFDQMADGELDGKPVWILRGTWKDGKLPVNPASLGGSGAGAGPTGIGALPSYVPSLVTLYLGRDDAWPYKIVFEGRLPAQIEKRRKKEEIQLDATGRPIAKALTSQTTRQSKLVMIYSNVKINTPIPDETFAFSPPETAKVRDETELIVSQLEQVIASQAEKKKAKASQAGPVLDGGPIAPAPKP